MKRWAGLGAVLAVAVFVGSRAALRPRRPETPAKPPVAPPADPAPAASPQLTVAHWLGWQIREAKDGVEVVSVYEGGPAARAGLVAGDRLATVGGEKATAHAVLAAIQHAKVGDAIAFGKQGPDGVEPISIAVASASSVDALLARTIAGGVKALVAVQGADGLWSDFEVARPGAAVSALACAALAAVGSSGGDTVGAALARGVAALLARRGPDGGLDASDGKLAHRVYANAALVLALPAGKERDGLRDWLARAQIAGPDPLDARHGGFRSDADDRRPDISVTAWALEALARAKLGEDRDEWARANRFVERCQNVEVRVDAREAPLRDGGFAFAPGVSKAGRDDVSDELSVPRSYGSATADGVRALVALGAASDPRTDAALAWLARRWTADRVPGFEEMSPWAHGLELYWACAVARALDAAKVDSLGGHDWPDELAHALARRQDPANGSFAASSGLMGEDSPAVATSLALLALAAARDRRAHGDGRAIAAAPPVVLPPLAPWSPGDASVIERGRQVFQGRLGCVGCHSDVASGNGPALVGVADRYLEWKRTRAAAAEHLHRHIRDPRAAPGQHADRWPRDRMPSFGEASGLGDEDLDALVEFLLSRQGALPVSDARAPGSGVKGSAQRGAEVAFERKCASCHDSAYFKSHRKPDFTKHPPFAKALSEQEIADLVAFLKTIR